MVDLMSHPIILPHLDFKIEQKFNVYHNKDIENTYTVLPYIKNIYRGWYK